MLLRLEGQTMDDAIDQRLLEQLDHPRPSAEEALRLSRAFYRVKNPDSRAAVIAFAERCANDREAALTAHTTGVPP